MGWDRLGFALVLVPVIAGCGGEDDAPTDTMATVDTGQQPETGDPDTGDTEPGDTEPGDTEPGDTEPGDTENGGGLPDECFAQDPAVDAAFSLDLADWGLDDEHDITVECVVDALTEIEGARLRTELTCDHDGTERVTALEIAAPFSAGPTWAAGDNVQLRAARYETNKLSFDHADAVRLQRGDTELLVFAFVGGEFAGSPLPDPEWWAPITLGIDDSLCGEHPELVDPTPQQLLVGEVADCCSGEVRGGQRGLIDLSSAYSGFDVDIARLEVDATGDEAGDSNYSNAAFVLRAADIGI